MFHVLAVFLGDRVTFILMPAANVIIALACVLAATGIISNMGLNGAMLVRLNHVPTTPCPAIVVPVESAYCDDGEYCTADLLDPVSGTCAYRARPNTYGCTSPCATDGAVSTFCDPKTSSCKINDPLECLGWCDVTADIASFGIPYNIGDSGCVAKFPFNQWYTNGGSDLYSAPYAACALNSCVMSVLVQTFNVNKATDTTDHPRSMLFTTCDQLIDHALVDVDTCIEKQELVVDSNITGTMMKSLFGVNYNLAASGGKMCIFRYGCMPLNASALDDPVLFERKRSVLDQVELDAFSDALHRSTDFKPNPRFFAGLMDKPHLHDSIVYDALKGALTTHVQRTRAVEAQVEG